MGRSVRWAAAATGMSTGRRYAGGSSAAQSLKHLAGLALQGGTLFPPSPGGPYRPYRSSHNPRITHLDIYNHETQTLRRGDGAAPCQHTERPQKCRGLTSPGCRAPVADADGAVGLT
ncbi:hypothetical protein CPLU01_11134 [Colletotrichum plurivorum]|uniref:Uncharacterized protein n=1 Tax=Colletotrichum plurivorum TaxID=2175906 RepID=A0A8H6N914_9PEZI|nr:hypothetical protein CPLU01_11134 [Colletotrichum plurivorum]